MPGRPCTLFRLVRSAAAAAAGAVAPEAHVAETMCSINGPGCSSASSSSSSSVSGSSSSNGSSSNSCDDSSSSSSGASSSSSSGASGGGSVSVSSNNISDSLKYCESTCCIPTCSGAQQGLCGACVLWLVHQLTAVPANHYLLKSCEAAYPERAACFLLICQQESIGICSRCDGSFG
eukprot:360045-Chlamydomonas_euryale.AAC.7